VFYGQNYFYTVQTVLYILSDTLNLPITEALGLPGKHTQTYSMYCVHTTQTFGVSKKF